LVSWGPLVIAPPLAGSLLAPLRCDGPCQSRSRATWRPLRYPRLSQVAFVPPVRSRCLSSTPMKSRSKERTTTTVNLTVHFAGAASLRCIFDFRAPSPQGPLAHAGTRGIPSDGRRRAGPLICLGRAGDACVVGALERVGDTLYGARVYVKLGRRLAHA